MRTPTFSQRHGFRKDPAPIAYRQEAPERLRLRLLQLGRRYLAPDGVRTELCMALGEVPDEAGNWSESNIMMECRDLILNSEWFHVYDACETLYRRIARAPENGHSFQAELNQIFLEEGVGWQMEDGVLVTRGEEPIQNVVQVAREQLVGKYPTASQELNEAIRDLSRKPEPDVSGAVQHSVAALECLAKELSGERSKTLGAIIPTLGLPKTLEISLDKLWGFASDQGRHITEGKVPTFRDAQLTVHVVAVFISFFLEHK